MATAIDPLKIAPSKQATWHILTGEYPPDHGGVSDYTRSVAVGLVNAGVEVHVWTRGSASDETREGVVVHRCLGAFERSRLTGLQQELNATKSRSTLLVQYVPHGFGMRAMNIPLARWIGQQSQSGIDVRLMLHELAFPFVRWPMHHNLIAVANRWMLRSILHSPKRIYLSTTAWQPMVNRFSPTHQESRCLPIPSNIPGTRQSQSAAVRQRFTAGDPNEIVVGHFGTFGGEIRRLALETFCQLLARSPRIQVALIGRGANAAQSELLAANPDGTQDRVFAIENADEDEIATWIQACDIMLQPYPDGISTRRTSAMAGFANGVAVVSNMGTLAESFWREHPVGSFADKPDVELLTRKTLELAEKAELRSSIAAAGRALHDERFTIAYTIRTLLKDG